MTPKTFSVTLLVAVMKRLGMGISPIQGSAMAIYRRVISMLVEHPELVIIVDEVDYAFKHVEILGALRDIVDETLAIVILIGMENAKDRLLQINQYYFNRCGVFYQFKPATEKDVDLILKETMEVGYDQAIVERVHRISKGELRSVVKLIHSYETTAKAKDLKKITSGDLD
jgi:hypothetical protein